MKFRCAFDPGLGSAGLLARRARRPAGRILQNCFLAAFAVLTLFFCPTRVSAAAPAGAPALSTTTSNAVSPEQLSLAIDRVLQQRQFAWRMPREKPVASDAEKGWLARAAQFVVDVVRDAVKAAAHGLRVSLQWVGRMLLKLWPGSFSGQPGLSGWGSRLIYSLQILLLLLISVLLGFLAVLVFRAYDRRRRPNILVAEPVAARPDLTDENVAPDQLPEDGWLSLARDLMQEGNLRLALRAFYLAGLAHLAARGMISIAIFKSNREYESELRRRARAAPEVQSAFSQNVAAFDHAWYGLREVTREALLDFQANLARIRAC